MAPTTMITKTAQTTLLCAGLITASVVWSCPENTGAANSANQDRAQAQAPTVGAKAPPTTLSGARLHALFHDPVLNKPDGLASDAEDFRAAFPR